MLESKGRGRGGGVPLLPEGLWDSLNRTDLPDSTETAVPAEFGGFGANKEPKGFAQGRGNGRGRGIQKDMKGADWNCPSCGNVNWSWRATCNKCNGAKPASILVENEIRDGVGGGFNERQNRVSAASVEVGEDGFDDFGRRVKKDRRDKQMKEQAALARLQQSYGFLLGAVPMPSENGHDAADQFQDASEESNGRNASNNRRDYEESSKRKRNDIDDGREERNTSNDVRKVDFDTTDRGRGEGYRGREREREGDSRQERERQDRDRDRGRDRDRTTTTNSDRDSSSRGNSSRAGDEQRRDDRRDDRREDRREDRYSGQGSSGTSGNGYGNDTRRSYRDRDEEARADRDRDRGGRERERYKY